MSKRASLSPVLPPVPVIRTTLRPLRAPVAVSFPPIPPMVRFPPLPRAQRKTVTLQDMVPQPVATPSSPATTSPTSPAPIAQEYSGNNYLAEDEAIEAAEQARDDALYEAEQLNRSNKG